MTGGAPVAPGEAERERDDLAVGELGCGWDDLDGAVPARLGLPVARQV